MEITLDYKYLQLLADHREGEEYLKKMNFTPIPLRKYSLKDQIKVREKVTQLPSEELVVIYLTFWENLCEYEIARTIYSTVARVIKTKNSALLRLKEMMEKNDENKELYIA